MVACNTLQVCDRLSVLAVFIIQLVWRIVLARFYNFCLNFMTFRKTTKKETRKNIYILYIHIYIFNNNNILLKVCLAKYVSNTNVIKKRPRRNTYSCSLGKRIFFYFPVRLSFKEPFYNHQFNNNCLLFPILS